jgi:hypothetical protein
MTQYDDDIRQTNPSLVESGHLTYDLHVPPGASVYDVAGEKLGKVRGRIAVGGRFRLTMGALVLHEYYVPKSAIIRIDSTGIHLDVTKDEVKNSGWDHQPAESIEALGGQQANHEEQETEPPMETDQ